MLSLKLFESSFGQGLSPLLCLSLMKFSYKTSYPSAGQSVDLSVFPKRAESYTFMLLSKHLFLSMIYPRFTFTPKYPDEAPLVEMEDSENIGKIIIKI